MTITKVPGRAVVLTGSPVMGRRRLSSRRSAQAERIVHADPYRASAQGSTERIRVRQVWPFTAAHPRSIAEIADVR